jgi:hypothetical protein
MIVALQAAAALGLAAVNAALAWWVWGRWR